MAEDRKIIIEVGTMTASTVDKPEEKPATTDRFAAAKKIVGITKSLGIISVGKTAFNQSISFEGNRTGNRAQERAQNVILDGVGKAAFLGGSFLAAGPVGAALFVGFEMMNLGIRQQNLSLQQEQATIRGQELLRRSQLYTTYKGSILR